jgi:hypothetical protein
MKHLLFTLLLATFCATGYGQTIKSLGYDTATGEVVANTGTNVLTFTNAVVTFNGVTSEGFSFDGGANFDLANGELRFGVNDIYSVGSGTSFDLFVPIGFAGDEAATNAAITRTNLGLGATWLTNTNVSDFRDAIGLGATNEAQFGGILLGDGDFIKSSAGGDGDLFISATRTLFNGNIEFDNTTNAAITRTNLGLGGGIATNISVLVSGGGTNTLQFSNGILTNVTSP